VDVLVTFILFGIMAVAASAQTNALSPDVLAANKELDRQLLEGHRLLDAEKVMGLFTSSADIFFIAPSGELYKGRDQVRQAWERFFAGLQSIHGDIDHISYLPAGDGVIAVGQVTYYRQLKGRAPDKRIVVWTDFRHKDNGKWVYVFVTPIGPWKAAQWKNGEFCPSHYRTSDPSSRSREKAFEEFRELVGARRELLPSIAYLMELDFHDRIDQPAHHHFSVSARHQSE
jgi:ketosteroid isomerase-like protein